MKRIIVSWWWIFCGVTHGMFRFITHVSEDCCMLMRYYIWWLSSVANFYENQIMHFWKNIDIASKLFDLFVLLHDYCIWGLGCYRNSPHLWDIPSHFLSFYSRRGSSGEPFGLDRGCGGIVIFLGEITFQLGRRLTYWVVGHSLRV